MRKSAKCIQTNKTSCDQSLVFRFMRIAKWVALLLLLGIGFADIWLQLQRSQAINWLFFSLCSVGGIGLFWIGHCIMQSECAMQRRCGTCNRDNASTAIPIRSLLR